MDVLMSREDLAQDREVKKLRGNFRRNAAVADHMRRARIKYSAPSVHVDDVQVAASDDTEESAAILIFARAHRDKIIAALDGDYRAYAELESIARAQGLIETPRVRRSKYQSEILRVAKELIASGKKCNAIKVAEILQIPVASIYYAYPGKGALERAARE